MRKNILLVILWLLAFLPAISQPKDYRVVFDCTSKDSMEHKAVLRWINEILSTSPDAKLEVVLYAQSLGMVIKDRSTVAPAISKLLVNKNISFKVCAVAMKNQQVEPSQLLPGIETVPDGIYEIISKQREGWGYIKASL
jgi:intracellular sulfur oxidation DsrE/DsrF family protein